MPHIWEKDKLVLKKYTDCVQEFISQARAGEEVEWEDACAVERGKMEQYVSNMITHYKYFNPEAHDE